MKIRAKVLSAFLIVSIAPISVIGAIGFFVGRDAVVRNLGGAFQAIAHHVADRVGALRKDVAMDTKMWASLPAMQEVITGDLDGRISSILFELAQEYGRYGRIAVLDTTGKVVGCSDGKCLGMDWHDAPYFQQVISGKPFLGDIAYAAENGEWIVTVAYPIKGAFDPEQVIGLVVSMWKADAIHEMIQASAASAPGQAYTVWLARGDGLLFSAPAREEEGRYRRNLVAAGLKSAQRARAREEGYLVEKDETGRSLLIGYHFVENPSSVKAPPWLVLVSQDTRTAWAPVRRLEFLVMTITAGVSILVILLSYIIAHLSVRPALLLSEAAERVSNRDFDVHVDYRSRDEVGVFVEHFNQMVAHLKETTVSRNALQQEILQRARTEADLRSAQLQLIQAAKLESVGRLAAGVAHEVKNPLGTLFMGLDYLAAKTAAPEGGELREVLESMKDAVRRADRVIKGLLDFSRPEKLEFKAHDINEVIETALQMAGHVLSNKHIIVMQELGRDIPPALIDPHKLEQVFINLFTNAAQAMQEGGEVFIRTRVEKLEKVGGGVGRRAHDMFRLGETAIVAEVDDTGPGIPPEILSRIFEPFVTTKQGKEGIGLGLSVSKSIVELHGGHIDISNRPEGGVRARVMLKRA